VDNDLVIYFYSVWIKICLMSRCWIIDYPCNTQSLSGFFIPIVKLVTMCKITEYKIDNIYIY